MPWYIPIIAAVVSAGLGSAITYWATQYRGRLRQLYYIVTSTSGLFKQPYLEGKEIRITLDGQQIQDVSTINVAFSNSTDSDWENVPLLVSFSHKNGKVPVLLHAKVTLPTLNNMLLEGMVELKPSAATKELRVEYMLPVVNRRQKSDPPTLKATYTFEGSEAPEVSVALKQKGLKAKLLSGYDEVQRIESKIDFIFLVFITFLLIVAVIAWLIVKVTKLGAH